MQYESSMAWRNGLSYWPLASPSLAWRLFQWPWRSVAKTATCGLAMAAAYAQLVSALGVAFCSYAMKAG
jgi:hypothetical protein